jgi:hypothetical protein
VLTYERLLLVQNFARKSDPDYKPCLPGRLVAAVPLAAKTPGATDTTRTTSAGLSTCFVTNTSPSSVATGTRQLVYAGPYCFCSMCPATRARTNKTKVNYVRTYGRTYVLTSQGVPMLPQTRLHARFGARTKCPLRSGGTCPPEDQVRKGK